MMGITFGDHLIDSGRYEFTPEEERERDESAAGMIWWNALDDKERKSWMERAGNTGCAFDAWKAFRNAQEAERAEREYDLAATLIRELGEPDYKLARLSHGTEPWHYWSRESIERACRAVKASTVPNGNRE
jgi:hypothetical protein